MASRPRWRRRGALVALRPDPPSHVPGQRERPSRSPHSARALAPADRPGRLRRPARRPLGRGVQPLALDDRPRDRRHARRPVGHHLRRGGARLACGRAATPRPHDGDHRGRVHRRGRHPSDPVRHDPVRNGGGAADLAAPGRPGDRGRADPARVAHGRPRRDPARSAGGSDGLARADRPRADARGPRRRPDAGVAGTGPRRRVRCLERARVERHRLRRVPAAGRDARSDSASPSQRPRPPRGCRPGCRPRSWSCRGSAAGCRRCPPPAPACSRSRTGGSAATAGRCPIRRPRPTPRSDRSSASWHGRRPCCTAAPAATSPSSRSARGRWWRSSSC